MIELKNLRKSYKTGDFVQKALDGVSLTFRDNEFVAVLGPSGSGKTTLLNVLGGLDTADEGDIVINGTSTKDYRSADWDTYRNHRIGFIFQSYNLIPHQTVAANVELALTLAGIDRAERRQRALAALDRVGLAEHANKKPNQLSGGQMQRVAIARALVNDPDIVLADEPTGALDTETGVQVMNLLQEIASDRLVIMVTHNPELAERYATRIVRLSDGRIVSDTNPLVDVEDEAQGPAAVAPVAAVAGLVAGAQSANGAKPSESATKKSDPKRRARMGFLTALGLSFNNLMTKKGRTFMTAFAGSIGIIGIAAILSLSNGVNNYIAETEEEALTSFPLTITKSSFDMSGLFAGSSDLQSSDEDEAPVPAAGADAANAQDGQGGTGAAAGTGDTLIAEVPIMTEMFAQVKNNDLATFKEFLDSDESGISPYVSTIEYDYGIVPNIYKTDTSEGVTQLNPSSMGMTLSGGVDMSAFGMQGSGTEIFYQLMDSREMLENYVGVVAGRWPEAYDECAIVLSSTGRITDYTLYSIGYYDPEIMDQMTQDALNGKEVTAPETAQDFSFDKALKMEFSVVPSSSMYDYNASQHVWTDISHDEAIMKQRIADGVKLKVVGVMQALPDTDTTIVQQGVAYTPALTEYLMQQAASSRIVKQQQGNRDVDVFTGKSFEELQDEQGSEFDMSSMFTVDEKALEKAFGIDESAFDFSSMGNSLNMNSLALENVDMSSLGMDASSMQLDPSALQGAFDESAMRTLMANAPAFSVEESGMVEQATDLTPEQQQMLQEVTDALSADFLSWAMTNNKLTPGGLPQPAVPQAVVPEGATQDAGQAAAQAPADQASADQPGVDPQTASFSALFQEYMQTESAQAIMRPATQQLGQQIEDTINASMQNYMTNQFIPYFSNGMQALMAQAAQGLALQMAQAMQEQVARATQSLGSTISNTISGQLTSQMAQLQEQMQSGFNFDMEAFSNAIQFNMTQDDLTSLLTNFLNADELTYDANMKKLGYADKAHPDSISIYPIDFEAKEAVIGIIDDYNKRAEDAGSEESVIQYSDLVGILMSSVTRIIDSISLVLIAFVSISLVVSSIMIGIITYISVLERKKEIGILRAMGASRRNIANVFNAETFIEGLVAGLLAILVVLIASVPVNAVVEQTRGVHNIMILPWEAALVLICISVGLTLIAGIIPSQSAARRDPVEALRSE